MKISRSALFVGIATLLAAGNVFASDITGKWEAECTDDSFGTRVVSSRVVSTFGSAGAGSEKTFHYAGRHCSGEAVRTELKTFKYSTAVLSEKEKDQWDTDSDLLLTATYAVRSVEDGDALQIKIGITFLGDNELVGEALEVTLKNGASTVVYGPDELRGQAEPTELKRVL